MYFINCHHSYYHYVPSVHTATVSATREFSHFFKIGFYRSVDAFADNTHTQVRMHVYTNKPHTDRVRKRNRER